MVNDAPPDQQRRYPWAVMFQDRHPASNKGVDSIRLQPNCLSAKVAMATKKQSRSGYETPEIAPEVWVEESNRSR